jgi:hypothetical protein
MLKTCNRWRSCSVNSARTNGFMTESARAEVPAFVQFDSPLQLMGPTLRIELISPRVHVSTGNVKHASR